MNTRTRDLIAIGLVMKVFGIKGDVIVRPMTANPGRFKKLGKVYLSRHPERGHRSDLPESPMVVERASVDPRGIRLKVSGIENRTDAGHIVGCYLCVDETDRIHLPSGKFFVHDIVGLTVVDQGGRTIGTVKDVLRLPANDVYVIAHEGREVMIPAVREFIKLVDLASRSMHVALIEGMLEE